MYFSSFLVVHRYLLDYSSSQSLFQSIELLHESIIILISQSEKTKRCLVTSEKPNGTISSVSPIVAMEAVTDSDFLMHFILTFSWFLTAGIHIFQGKQKQNKNRTKHRGPVFFLEKFIFYIISNR